MGLPFSEDIRWLVVYKRVVLGQTHWQVTAAFEGLVKERCQKKLLRLFYATGGVTAQQGDRAAAPANQKMTPEHLLHLLERLILSPTTTQKEHRLHFEVECGLIVHKSTICRAVRELYYRRQKVRSP